MADNSDSLLWFAVRRPLHYVWGLAADAAFVVYTLALAPLAIFGTLLLRSGRPTDWIGKAWSRMIVWTCGIRVEVHGLDKLAPDQSYVLISNHLSNFDIWCTFAALPLNIRFVAKKELTRIPLFGQALTLSDHVVIDRARPEEAIRTINDAVARKREAFCLLFYAEGTRSPDGKVQAFKKGGVTLALRTALPIVPLSVSGTRKFLPKRHKVIRPGGTVRLVLADPIETRGIPLEDRDRLNERVREIVIRNYDESV